MSGHVVGVFPEEIQRGPLASPVSDRVTLSELSLDERRGIIATSAVAHKALQEMAHPTGDEAWNHEVTLGAPTSAGFDEPLPFDPFTSEAAPEAAEVEVPKRRYNYTIELRLLVAQILKQLAHIAELERTKTEELKGRYSVSSKEASDLQRKLGNAGFILSAVAFGVMYSQFFFPQGDRKMIEFLSQQIGGGGGGGLGSIWTGGIQADQKTADSLSQLMLQEYTQRGNKGQLDANSKQELLSLLREALDALKQAARGNA